MFAKQQSSPNATPAAPAPAAPTPAAPPAAPRGLVRLARSRLAAALLLGLAVVLLAGSVGWRYVGIERDNEALAARRAGERANALATQLRDTVSATFLQADTVLSLARQITEARLAGNKQAELALRPFLEPAGGTHGPDAVQVAGIDSSGMLVWSNLNWNTAPMSVRDRDFYVALSRQPTLQLFVGAPVVGRISNQWSVHLARAVRDGNGALRFITDIALDAKMLARLCSDIALAPDDRVTLLRDDGTVLMRSDPKLIGDPAAPPLPPVSEFSASRPVAGLPLTVRVDLSKAAQLAAQEQVRRGLWSFDLLRDGAIVAAGLALGGALLLLRRAVVASAQATTHAQDETWFESVIDEMSDGVVVFDRLSDNDLSIAFASRAASEMFGYSKLRLAGRDFASLVHPEDRDWVAARKQAAWHEHSLHAAEYRLHRPDRATLWVRASSVVTVNPQDPSRLRMITTLRNVTEEHERAAALAETRARLDRVLNIVPGVFYHLTVDPAGISSPLFVSDSAASMFGVSPAEAAQPGFLVQRVRRAGADLMALRKAAVSNAPDGGIAIAEYPASDGKTTIWLRDTLRGIPLPHGHMEMVGFLTDATSEHAADEARRAAETQTQRLNWALTAYSLSLSSLVRSGALSEVVARVCDSIVTQSPYVLAWVGVPEQGPGKPVRIVASAGSAKGYAEGLKISWSADEPEGQGPTSTAFREGSSYLLKDSLTDPSYALWRERGQRYGIRSSVTLSSKVDERVVAVLVVYASIPDAFGPDEFALFRQLSDEIGFTIALDEDRARMRALEDRRRQAEQNLRDAVQLGPGLLYRARVYPDRVEVQDVFGDQARLTLGIAGAAGHAASLSSILSRPDIVADLREQADDGIRVGDYALQTAGGDTRWLRNNGHVTGREDTAIELVGYISDVTREKQQQLHRQQMTTLLTLGEMATGMAHELNQPLASISIAAQNVAFLLQRDPPDLTTASRKIDSISAQVARATKLVEHIRVFARNEPDAMQPVSWRTALDSALDILSHKLHGVQVEADVPDSLPMVAGWPIPMEQVLINLIGNAVDAYQGAAAPAPWTVTVQGRVEDGMVVLRVSDRAGGIPPEALPRLFEPFFTTKAPGKGTGLGLALAFGTIVDMGGSMTAANADGGAVFEIRVPPVAVQQA